MGEFWSPTELFDTKQNRLKIRAEVQGSLRFIPKSGADVRGHREKVAFVLLWFYLNLFFLPLEAHMA